MRDLFIALFVLGALPVSFKRPVAGMLTFSLLAYMRLQDLAWGFARYERWSFYVAIAMVVGYAFQREKHPPIWSFRTGLLLFMPAWAFLGLLRSIGLEAFTSGPYVEYVKIIFIALFTTMVVRRREHLRALMWVIGGSFAFFGLKNGVATVLSGGSLYIIQGPGGMLADNNDFALALAMSVPIIVGLATSEVNPYYRRWLKIFVPFTALSILATRSRGGFLSLSLATFILVWRSRSRIAGLMLMGVAAGVGLMFLPPEVFERLKTLKDVGSDGSAMGRLEAWRVAGQMIRDYPLLGVGFDQFQSYYLDYGTLVDTKSGTRVAHNGYLQIWSETGTPVFLAYVTLLVTSVLALQRLRREAKRVYERSWIISYCTALEGAIAVFMLGSTFLNRAHFDLIYHYFAIVLVLERVARAEMAAPFLQATGRRGAPGRLTRREDFGFDRKQARGRGFRTTDLSPAIARGSGGGFSAPRQPD